MSSTAQIETPVRRYCEDCRFFQAEDGRKLYARCGKAAPISDDRFVARELDRPPFAATVRGSSRLCGPDARWFEPAPAPLSVVEAA